MIHYQLLCAAGHGFDGWFKDSTSFEHQASSGFVACPVCSTDRVTRALMAPAISRGRLEASGDSRSPPPGGLEDAKAASPDATSGKAAPVPAAPPPAAKATAPVPANLRALLQRLRAEVEKSCDYVGRNFAEEARKMSAGERDTRGIYGETTPDEAEALAEEGIAFGTVPWLPPADS